MLVFIVLIITLSIIVMIHELGHFVAAKKLGVRVEEFGVGIPPRLFGKRIGETIYSVNLLPFGGFVKLKGEDEVNTSSEARKDPENFASKSPLQRIVILAAGVSMNLVLGVVFYYAILALNGFGSLSIPLFFDYQFKFGRSEVIDTTVLSFIEESPALLSGIEAGEAIVSLDGVPVSSVKDVREYVANKEDMPVQVSVVDLRQASRPVRTVEVKPQWFEEAEGVVLGVQLSPSVSIHYDSKAERLLSGPLHSYNILSYTGYTLGNLVKLSFKERDISPVADSVSGPVGVYSVIDGIFKFGGPKAYLGLMDLVALMSVSLAVINLLPFPALDGGRIFFVFLEGVWGRRVLPKVEEMLHRWGMVALLVVLVMVTARDILRIFE